jgi:hypothetical protein
MAGTKTANAAQKWLSGMQGASTAYIAGTSAPKRNPMQAAAANLQLYLTKTQQAVSSGHMAARLNATPLQSYTDGCAKKGAPRLASGAQASLPKMQSFFTRWAPIFQQASDAAAAIPRDGTMGTALAKVQAALQVMMQNKGN